MNDLMNEKIDDSYSNGTSDSQMDRNLKSNISNIISLSDPTLFHSVTNDTVKGDVLNAQLADATNTNDTDLSNEEVNGLNCILVP